MDQKEIMQTIADQINSSAKKKWKLAHLDIKVLNGIVNTKLRFEYEDNPMGWEFISNVHLVTKAVINYHTQLHETGNAKWNKMFFKLTFEGKINIEFEWDQALQDEYEKNSRS